MNKFWLPEFHDGSIRWSSEKFKSILQEHGLDPDKDAEKVIAHNNLIYSAPENCYWEGHFYWENLRGDTCTMKLKG